MGKFSFAKLEALPQRWPLINRVITAPMPPLATKITVFVLLLVEALLAFPMAHKIISRPITTNKYISNSQNRVIFLGSCCTASMLTLKVQNGWLPIASVHYAYS